MIARKTQFEDLPAELAAPLRITDKIVSSYLFGLNFIVHDTARDSKYAENNLLYYLSQDLLQSAISVISLSMEGLISVAKRELRFIIESSIKLCYVNQKSYSSTVAQKLIQFEKELASQRISIKENLDLEMLPKPMWDTFTEEVGRLYGLTSNYVHLSPSQITERIEAVNAGRFAGKESPSDLENLNEIASKIFAASLVLIFHSVPSWVAGDFLVESDGNTVRWYFSESRFIAAMDSYFDYKHERQENLQKIVEMRAANIKF